MSIEGEAKSIRLGLRINSFKLKKQRSQCLHNRRPSTQTVKSFSILLRRGERFGSSEKSLLLLHRLKKGRLGGMIVFPEASVTFAVAA